MNDKRIHARIFAMLFVLVVHVSGAGLAEAQVEEPVPASGSSTSERCTGIPLQGDLQPEPEGDAQCDVLSASADHSTGALAAASRASTASESDPTGLLASGQAVASTSGSLGFEGRLRGAVSAATIRVRVANINAEVSRNSPSVRGSVHLFVVAWSPQIGFANREMAIFPLAETGSPGLPVGEELLVELELSGKEARSGKLTNRIFVQVQLGSASQIGFVDFTSGECDDDGRCDGSGVATAEGSVRVDSVTMELTR